MSTVREYVADMTAKDRIKIIADAEKYDKTGIVQEGTMLRNHAEAVAEMVGDKNHDHILLWIRELIYETYRYFYYNTL